MQNVPFEEEDRRHDNFGRFENSVCGHNMILGCLKNKLNVLATFLLSFFTIAAFFCFAIQTEVYQAATAEMHVYYYAACEQQIEECW